MSESTGITTTARAHLRRPFTSSAVKWLPLGKVSDRGVMMQPHINASLVFERLGEVDPSWTHETVPLLPQLGLATPADAFGKGHGSPWVCRLTLLGVTRSDVGQLDADAKADNKHLKTGHSDAIKRAALGFEVGAYLRAFDSVWLPRQHEGAKTFRTSSYQGKERFTGLDAAGKKYLRAHYDRIVGHRLFIERYGEAVEYGDLVTVDDTTADEPDALMEEAVAQASDHQLEVLVLLGSHNGRETPAETYAETLQAKPFQRVLPMVMRGVVTHLALDTEVGEQLRRMAVDASEGNAAALGDLQRRLGELAAEHAARNPAEEPAAAAADADAPSDGGLF